MATGTEPAAEPLVSDPYAVLGVRREASPQEIDAAYRRAALEGGLEYPHYTRPADFRGWRVPDVLLSGDHARVDAWRREQSRLRSAA